MCTKILLLGDGAGQRDLDAVPEIRTYRYGGFSVDNAVQIPEGLHRRHQGSILPYPSYFTTIAGLDRVNANRRRLGGVKLLRP